MDSSHGINNLAESLTGRIKSLEQQYLNFVSHIQKILKQNWGQLWVIEAGLSNQQTPIQTQRDLVSAEKKRLKKDLNLVNHVQQSLGKGDSTDPVSTVTSMIAKALQRWMRLLSGHPDAKTRANKLTTLFTELSNETWRTLVSSGDLMTSSATNPKIQELQKENAKLRERISNLSSLISTNDRSEDRTESLERAKQRADSYKHEVERMQGEITFLQANMTPIRHQNATPISEISFLQSQGAAKACTEFIHTLKDWLLNSKDPVAVNKAKHTLESFLDLQSEPLTLTQSPSELQELYLRAESSRKHLEDKLSKLFHGKSSDNRNVQLAQQELAQHVDLMQQRQAERFRSFESIFTNLDLRLQQLIRSLSLAKSRAKQWKNKASTAEIELEQAESALFSAQNEVEIQLIRLEQVQEKLTTAESCITKLQTRNSDKSMELHSLHNAAGEVEQIKLNLASSLAQNDQLTQTMQAMSIAAQREQTALHQQISEQQTTSDTLKRHLADSADEVRRVKTENVQLNTRLQQIISDAQEISITRRDSEATHTLLTELNGLKLEHVQCRSRLTAREGEIRTLMAIKDSLTQQLETNTWTRCPELQSEMEAQRQEFEHQLSQFNMIQRMLKSIFPYEDNIILSIQSLIRKAQPSPTKSETNSSRSETIEDALGMFRFTPSPRVKLSFERELTPQVDEDRVGYFTESLIEPYNVERQDEESPALKMQIVELKREVERLRMAGGSVVPTEHLKEIFVKFAMLLPKLSTEAEDMLNVIFCMLQFTKKEMKAIRNMKDKKLQGKGLFGGIFSGS